MFSAFESPRAKPALCIVPESPPYALTYSRSDDLPFSISSMNLESDLPSTNSLTSTLSSIAAPTTLGVLTPELLSFRAASYSLCILAWGDMLNFMLGAHMFRNAHFIDRMSAKCLKT